MSYWVRAAVQRANAAASHLGIAKGRSTVSASTQSIRVVEVSETMNLRGQGNLGTSSI